MVHHKHIGTQMYGYISMQIDILPYLACIHTWIIIELARFSMETFKVVVEERLMTTLSDPLKYWFKMVLLLVFLITISILGGSWQASKVIAKSTVPTSGSMMMQFTPLQVGVL